MSKHTDSKGNVMPKFVFIAMGQFKGYHCLVRYPQVKGVTWRKVSQALKRCLRKHFELKADGYLDVTGIIVDKPEHCHNVWDNNMKKCKNHFACLDYDEESGEFFHANP